MKSTIYLFGLLIMFSCKGQTQDDLAHDAVKQILDLDYKRWQVEGGQLKHYLLNKPLYNQFSRENVDKILLNDTNKIFSSEDKQTFYDQLDFYQNFSYTQDKINKIKVISLEEIISIPDTGLKFWKAYRDKFGDSGFFSISFPLFSIDRTKMLISIDECNFNSSCGGYTAIYIYEDNKWKLLRILSSYME